MVETVDRGPPGVCLSNHAHFDGRVAKVRTELHLADRRHADSGVFEVADDDLADFFAQLCGDAFNSMTAHALIVWAVCAHPITSSSHPLPLAAAARAGALARTSVWPSLPSGVKRLQRTSNPVSSSQARYVARSAWLQYIGTPSQSSSVPVQAPDPTVASRYPPGISQRWTLSKIGRCSSIGTWMIA